MTIKTDKLRKLCGDKGVFGPTLYIKDVYAGYLEGWTGPDGAKRKRTFKYFPKVAEQVLKGGLRDDGSRLTKEDELTLGREVREQIWNGETGKFDFHLTKDVKDREFYKNFPKMFDMVVTFENEVTINDWSKEAKARIDQQTKEAIVTVKANVLKDIIGALIEEPVPMEGEYPKRDYEDSFKDKLKGKFFKFKATKNGKKIGDKLQHDCYDFTYKEATPFAIVEDKPLPNKTEQGTTDAELDLLFN